MTIMRRRRLASAIAEIVQDASKRVPPESAGIIA
jgi:hypothetical protein